MPKSWVSTNEGGGGGDGETFPRDYKKNYFMVLGTFYFYFWAFGLFSPPSHRK